MDFICSKCLSHYLPVVVPYWLTLMSRTIQISSNTFSASSAVSVSWRSSNSNWVWPGDVWKVKSGSSFHAPYFILLRGKQFRGPAFSGMPLIRMHHEVGARLQTKDWNSLIFTEPQQKCCDFAMVSLGLKPQKWGPRPRKWVFSLRFLVSLSKPRDPRVCGCQNTVSMCLAPESEKVPVATT